MSGIMMMGLAALGIALGFGAGFAAGVILAIELTRGGAR